MTRTAGHVGKALAAWGWHHPAWAAVIIVAVILAAKWAAPAPQQGAAVVHDWTAIPIGAAVIGIAWYAVTHQKTAPTPASARVRHTTIVQHISQHVTKLPAGNGGWVVAGIGVVAAAVVVMFLNRTRSGE